MYRKEHPVRVHIAISRLGDKVWYLGTSFTDLRRSWSPRIWPALLFESG
jgi:hypothetical protein